MDSQFIYRENSTGSKGFVFTSHSDCNQREFIIFGSDSLKVDFHLKFDIYPLYFSNDPIYAELIILFSAHPYLWDNSPIILSMNLRTQRQNKNKVYYSSAGASASIYIADGIEFHEMHLLLNLALIMKSDDYINKL